MGLSLVVRLLVLVPLALLFYLSLWPVPVEPVSWQAPNAPEYLDDYAVNDKLAGFEALAMTGYSGPEDRKSTRLNSSH